MKTAISIPDALFQRADLLARRFHISRSELYARAVERFVEAHDEASTRAALDEVYAEESSDLPCSAVAAQAAIVSEWEDEG
jgi:metal-responsive CopG/Arc/MetJ family transcriptional regulator